jgi:hypothetical protein
MSTGELERMERVEGLLGAGLHEVDQVTIDVGRGRARLEPHVRKRRQVVRRRTVIAVAAAVIAVVVAAPIVIADLRDHNRALPVGPGPGVTLSPSGLPVGILQARVERTQPGATSTVRLNVHPEGGGLWNAGTVGDSEGDSTADYQVEFVADGPGRAVMRNEEAACNTPNVLRLRFIVRGRTVVITHASSDNCLVSRALAADLTGTTLRLQPQP